MCEREHKHSQPIHSDVLHTNKIIHIVIISLSYILRLYEFVWFVGKKSPWRSNPNLSPEPILPIRRIRKLRMAPETPGGPLALKDVLILVSSLASGYENMNDHFF